jgi:hypothetical protein
MEGSYLPTLQSRASAIVADSNKVTAQMLLSGDLRPGSGAHNGATPRSPVEIHGERCIARVFSRLEEPEEQVDIIVLAYTSNRKEMSIATVSFHASGCFADEGLWSGFRQCSRSESD